MKAQMMAGKPSTADPFIKTSENPQTQENWVKPIITERESMVFPRPPTSFNRIPSKTLDI